MERMTKSAQRESGLYGVDYADGRLSIYRWHGDDYESIGFGGTAEDFNQFDEQRPEEWFDVAAKMIAGRK